MAQRAAPADRPARRRHGRRRLVKTLEQTGPHVRPGQSRAGTRRRESGRRCRSWRWPWARSPGSAPRAWSPVALLADGARHRADVRRRAAAWWRAPRRDGRPRRSSAAAASTARNGTVDDVVDTEHEAFERTRRFLSYLPSSRRAAAARPRRPTIPGGATSALLVVHPQRTAGTATIRADHRGASSIATRSSRSAAAGDARSSPVWRGSTAGRSRVLAADPMSTAAG